MNLRRYRHHATAFALGAVLVGGVPGVSADPASSNVTGNTGNSTSQSASDDTNRSEDVGRYVEKATRNAWLDGKLETAYLLNVHLNNFRIDTRVEGDTAYLTGIVESDIDRDLAEAVALGVEGIENVENDLEIDRESARDWKDRDDVDSEGRTLADRINDATTTAMVKSKLLTSSAQGMNIDVDTLDSVVTLSGTVASSDEKALAEQLARNVDDVESVNNRLTVTSSS